MNKVAIRLGTSIILGICMGLLTSFLTDTAFGVAVAVLSGLIVVTSPDWRDL